MRSIHFITVFFILILNIFLFDACKSEKKNPNFQQEAQDPEYLHRAMTELTTVIKHDLFPPMVATRIYTYAHIAGYEALVAGTPQYKSLAGQLKGLSALPKPEADKEYCYPLASIKAYLKVGRKLIFSEDSLDISIKNILADFKNIGIPKDVFDRSIAFGDTIGGAILKWSTGDNYAQTRSMPKYTISTTNNALWKPTAPDYADALEPHWNKIRTMVMDSAAQFKPIPPTAFDTVKSSKFYKEAYEVFKSVQDSTPERIATAWYWDDNPSAVNNIGHVNFVRKKITPPGHWLYITKYITRAQKMDIFKSTEAYTIVAISMYDGVISCWDEKYRSQLVRPETYIGKYINPNWSPIINTPPFPEYTSGHSVFSGVASAALASIFSDNITFTDSTEVIFGLPPRTFKSLSEAADQAAISRMYAGIHYRPAIEEGVKQGRAVGKYVLSKIKLK
jgi:hypothetical protein